MVDQSLREFQYCTDGFSGYAALDYSGSIFQLRLASRRPIQLKQVLLSCEESRSLRPTAQCFSRCVEELRRLVASFVQCRNRRHPFKQAHPGYQSYPRDEASILIYVLPTII
ncbi:MAG: hypothetical protein NZM04_08025 [Methylacidiphilales bacterium]|nr:hypothetical protein [Candidatus Methylacidiphilales bacterium]